MRNRTPAARPAPIVALLVVLAMGNAISPAETGGITSSGTYSTREFERLSLDLRASRLSAVERLDVERAIRSGGAAALWDGYVEGWLDLDALRRYVKVFMKFIPATIYRPEAETFFRRLSRSGSPEAPLYFLPHTVPGGAPGARPCGPEETETVRPWWGGDPVRVCAPSHRPGVIFDEIGYCSGEAEPFMRQPPREGCGCGPMLMGCLPPLGDDGALDAMVRNSVVDEWFETAARIVAEDEPLDGLVNTTRTWQTGLTEFLYLRRQIIGELQADPWTPERQAGIEERVSAIDPLRSGRWVEREGLYRGTGLWWTAMLAHSVKFPVRAGSHNVLKTHLCSEFHAANVDADAILKAVGRQNQNLRTLSSIAASPMRTQEGCKGCHAPMDGAAGFMGELQASMYGSHPTAAPSDGELCVSGAGDCRGEGRGIAALARLILEQPEFETCSVRRAFETVLHRPLKSRDQELFERLVILFAGNGHRWRPIVAELLKSDAYLLDSAPHPSFDSAARPASEVPSDVRSLLSGTCVRCHDQKHYLDLTTPPSVGSTGTWKRILSRVSDYSMPPPDRKGAVEKRFPLDPSVRRSFTTALTKMLGPALESWDPPRRVSHEAWIGIASGIADGLLDPGTVRALIARHVPEDGVLTHLPRRNYSAAYALAVERAGETVCRSVASADSARGGKGYGISSTGPWKDTRRSVRLLLERVHGRSVADDELDEGVSLLKAFQEVAGTWKESWIALCSTHLSGPRTLFGAHIASHTGATE